MRGVRQIVQQDVFQSLYDVALSTATAPSAAAAARGEEGGRSEVMHAGRRAHHARSGKVGVSGGGDAMTRIHHRPERVHHRVGRRLKRERGEERKAEEGGKIYRFIEKSGESTPPVTSAMVLNLPERPTRKAPAGFAWIGSRIK